MSLIHDDFLLDSPMAQRLYHEVAALQPICDYHCHLPPHEVAEDQTWSDISELWLGGDHYKWRAMRAAGVREGLVTGGEGFERFAAWAKTVPQALRNPLYHWTHLELKRCFDIDTLLSPKTAQTTYEQVNQKLAEPGFGAQSLLKQFSVRVLGTTDDPIDDLAHHAAYAKQSADVADGDSTCLDSSCLMVPTLRPDKAHKTQDVVAWNAWVEQLAEAAGIRIQKLDDFVAALESRHQYFHDHGCRASDHGLDTMPYAVCTTSKVEKLFIKLRAGQSIGSEGAEQFATYILKLIARLNADKNWAMQLHIGPLRNNASRMLENLGPDTGFDSIDDRSVAAKLGAFLNSLDQTDQLPKTVLYNINPSQNYVMATMAANFQSNEQAIRGKVQFGSGWWHLDTLEGMTSQMNCLSSVGLLSTFVGMVTDSRSFLSFPRHEYFRRILCRLLGQDAKQGLVPDDFDLLAELVRGVSFENAWRYFGFDQLAASASTSKDVLAVGS